MCVAGDRVCAVARVCIVVLFFFFFQAEDGIRDYKVTGVQTCALPICGDDRRNRDGDRELLVELAGEPGDERGWDEHRGQHRSEEHTSELQSPCNLVCRLLLEKKKRTFLELLHLDVAPGRLHVASA